MSHTVVVLPCLNEAVTVGGLVGAVRRAVPAAQVVVVDNGSTDATAQVANVAGATVLAEQQPGKGAALRRAFRDLQADIWVMMDGDGTYVPRDAPALIQRLVATNADVVNGARTPVRGALSRRHALGNRGIALGLRGLFGSPFRDPLSGYKVLSGRFVASFPSVYDGFEIETELVVHAVRSQARCVEQPVTYLPRPSGSHSKLSSVRDGLRIARAMAQLRRQSSAATNRR